MRISELLVDGFGRVRDGVHDAVDGLTVEQLTYRADPDANTIGWLVWHLTRIQDDHVASAAGSDQAWIRNGWTDKFGLPFGSDATGYGHSADEVAAVAPTAELLVGYYNAVHSATVNFVQGLDEDHLDRVVDPSWDPPVTLGVRLMSVLNDDLQHVGQAAYVRGLAERAG